MSEVTLLQDSLNTKADGKLRSAVHSLFPSHDEARALRIDLSNTFFTKEKIMAMLGQSNGIRITYVIEELEEVLRDAHRSAYREEETKNFLKKIDTVESELTQLKNDLNL